MICDIIKTVLVILVLRQDVSSQLRIKGIPSKAIHGDVYRLQCSDITIWRFGGFWRFVGFRGKANFNRNSSHEVTVERIFFGCTVDKDDDVYGCESSFTTRTLIIKKINSTRDNNTHWSCSSSGTREQSNTYTIVVKTVPVSCNLTTTITHTMITTDNDDDDDNNNNEDDNNDKDNNDGDDDYDDDDGDDDDDDGQLVLHEGDDLNLNCSTMSSDQTTNISYKWEMFGEYSQTNVTDNQSIYFKPNITRRDAGMYVCTGSSGPECDKNDVVYVRVHYPLSLSLNITVNDTSEAIELICRVVGGYPTNFTINNWTHYIDGQFVRELEGVTTQDRTALVLNNTILNGGTYVCNATNGIKDFEGSVYQTGQIYINTEAPPMILEVSNASETHVESEVEIKAAFIISGDVLNITWYQQQQNSSNITEISVDTKSEHGIRPVNIYGTEINKRVTIISGSVMIREMVDLTVTVTVCTQYGCTYAVHFVIIVPEITVIVSEDQRTKSLDSAKDDQPSSEINIELISGVIVSIVLILLVGFIIFMVVRKKRQLKTNQESLTYTGIEIGRGEGRLESAYDDLATYVNQGVAITSSNDPPVSGVNVQHPSHYQGVANTSSNDPSVAGEANTSNDDPHVSGEILNNPTYDSLQLNNDARTYDSLNSCEKNIRKRTELKRNVVLDV